MTPPTCDTRIRRAMACSCGVVGQLLRGTMPLLCVACGDLAGLGNPMVAQVMVLHMPEPTPQSSAPDIVYDGSGTWMTAQLMTTDEDHPGGDPAALESAFHELTVHPAE